MDILSTARRLEAALAARIDRASSRVRSAEPREPLEVAIAVADAVAAHVQPGGRGRYVFPFTRVRITLAAATKAARARLEAIVDGEPSLTERVRSRLAAAGCDAAPDIRVVFVTAAAPEWDDPDFHLDLQRVVERASESPASDAPTLKLAVEHGRAARASYTFAAARINLGRCTDVRDRRDRLVRTNQVAFADDGIEANARVSRQHAHIAFDAAAAHYRLCDDRSAHGTAILRAGRLIDVPAGGRGLRLLTGDVIVLGDARLRVTLASD
jgi:hypothetical protein